MSSCRPWYDRSDHSLYGSQSLRLRQIAFLRLVRERIDIEGPLWLWNNVRDLRFLRVLFSILPADYITVITTQPFLDPTLFPTLNGSPQYQILNSHPFH